MKSLLRLCTVALLLVVGVQHADVQHVAVKTNLLYDATEDKIGRKISDVSVTAGWKNEAGEWISETEKLCGEVYTIEGVPNHIAVALKFIDKGEAVTTTHYYVIMNPDEDLTLVEDYIITVALSSKEKGEFVLE